MLLAEIENLDIYLVYWRTIYGAGKPGTPKAAVMKVAYGEFQNTGTADL